MRLHQATKAQRHGAIAPLALLLLVPLLGMMAFAIDIGYVVVAQTELQNVADAAAMAGGQQLMNPYTQWAPPRLTSTPPAPILANGKTSASQTAKNYAGYNKAGGVSIQLQDSDIVFGFTDAQGNFTTTLSATTFPNTIQVTARRDNTGGTQTNNPLALFF